MIQTKSTSEEVVNAIRDNNLGLAHLAAFWDSWSKPTQNGLKKLGMKRPNVDASTAPMNEVLDRAPAFVVCKAFETYQDAATTVNHANYISMHVAASNLSTGIQVSFNAENASVLVRKSENPIVGEDNTKVDDGEKKDVVGQLVVGKIDKKDINTLSATVATKVVSCIDLNAGVKRATATYHVKKGHISDQEWHEQASQVLGDVRLKSIVGAPYALLTMPIWTKYRDHLKSYIKGTVVNRSIGDVSWSLESLEKYETQYMNKEARQVCTFMDIPHQWMDAPLKWGAINGFLSGDYRKPCKSEYPIYGVGKWEITRLFLSDRSYDKEIITAPNIGVKVDPVLASRLCSMYTPVHRGDILDVKEYALSNAWDKKWNMEHVALLLKNLFTYGGVYRFKIQFTKLLKALQDVEWNKNFYIYILDFSIRSSNELFISVGKDKREEDQLVHRVTSYEDVQGVFLDIKRTRFKQCSNYLISMWDDLRVRLDVYRRPFKIEEGFWPVIGGAKSFKQVAKGHVSFGALTTLLRDSDRVLIQGEMAEFAEVPKGSGGVKMVKKSSQSVQAADETPPDKSEAVLDGEFSGEESDSEEKGKEESKNHDSQKW